MSGAALVAPRLPEGLAAIEVDGFEDEETIEGCEIRGALAGCVADDVTLDGCRLTGIRMTGAQFKRLRLRDCVLDTCDLSGAVIEQASWQRVELRDCRLTGAVLTNASWRHVRLQHCQANALAFRVAVAKNIHLDDCQLRDADWYGTQLTDVAVTGCDATNLEISQAKLERVRFDATELGNIRGVLSMSGATIDAGSITPLALSLFNAIGIEVADDEPG